MKDIPNEKDWDDILCTRNGARPVMSMAYRRTLEFLATWEEMYNPNFKVFESEHFKKQAGLLTFTPSVSEWGNRQMQ